MLADSSRLARIAVGVDFSAPSIAAIEWAAGWRDGAVELVLVHAVHAAAMSARLQPTDAERRLRTLARTVTADFVWCEVQSGNPADVVIAVAAEFHADLIVVGTRQPTRELPIGRGRVVDALADRAPVPVITVGESGVAISCLADAAFGHDTVATHQASRAASSGAQYRSRSEPAVVSRSITSARSDAIDTQVTSG